MKYIKLALYVLIVITIVLFGYYNRQDAALTIPLIGQEIISPAYFIYIIVFFLGYLVAYLGGLKNKAKKLLNKDDKS